MKPARLPSRMDVDSSVKGPFADEDWMPKLGLGGLLNAACPVMLTLNPMCMPLAFALWALQQGYMLRLMRLKAVNPKSKLPDWSEWSDLFLSGMSWLAIQFAFGLVLMAVAVAWFVALFWVYQVQKTLFSLMLLVAVSTSYLLWLFVQLVSSYLMVNFALEENVGAGLDIAKVCRRLWRSPRQCLQAWLLGYGLNWSFVLLPLCTLVGIFVVPSTMFLAQVMNAGLLIQAWQMTEPEAIVSGRPRS